jgi:uncharacterized membrane protein
MTATLLTGLALPAALGCGIVGGVFFAFSTFVMAALARLPAAQGIAAMQSINIVVINPRFMGAFLGTGLLCAALLAAIPIVAPHPGAAWLVAGSLLYLLGSIGVTLRFNVPRNNALAKMAPDSAEGAARWPRYVAEWTFWNHVRTAASLAAAAMFILALL